MAPQHTHHTHNHYHHHPNVISSPSFAPYSIPSNGGAKEVSLPTGGTNHLKSLSSSLPTGPGLLSSPPARQGSVPSASTTNVPPVALLSRRFVARRISEGETGRLKEELKCQACGKGYKHISSLAKHLWEHTPEWGMTSKLLISKHQQVQLLEAASILVSLNENEEEESQDDEAAAAAAAASAYLAKQQQQQLQINSRRKSLTSPAGFEGLAEDTNPELSKSPFTSPSLADDSSTPSPPPQPVTPNYSNPGPVLSRSAQLSNPPPAATASLTIPHHRPTHSRSTSLTTTIPTTSPAMASNSLITDSLYPTSSSFTSGTTSDLFSGLSSGTRSSLRHDDLLTGDAVSKRRNPSNPNHSNRSYARRMSALNPPSKVSTKMSLEYDDDEEQDDDDDDDDENVAVRDLDDGVFGEMDWCWFFFFLKKAFPFL